MAFHLFSGQRIHIDTTIHVYEIESSAGALCQLHWCTFRSRIGSDGMSAIYLVLTRMHSSRMRTGRSFTVRRGGGSSCRGGLPAQGGCLLARGVSLLGGSLLSGASLPGGSPCRGLPLWTESQTQVKT